ncbi:hypothetical protein QO004_000348 [Rhizobium mesoamericanum]|nr:hypothetical protein [Rhizobium mesoamericanum]
MARLTAKVKRQRVQKGNKGIVRIWQTAVFVFLSQPVVGSARGRQCGRGKDRSGALGSLDGVMQAPGGRNEDPIGSVRYGGRVAPCSTRRRKRQWASCSRKSCDIFAAHWPTWLLTTDRSAVRPEQHENRCSQRDKSNHYGIGLIRVPAERVQRNCRTGLSTGSANRLVP